MKKRKIMLTIVLLIMIIPLNIFAANETIFMECDNTKLNPGESTKCTIMAAAETVEIAGVDMTLSKSSNLTISNIVSAEGWYDLREDKTDPQITQTISSPKTGSYPLATFNVTASSIKTGYDATITLGSIVFSNKNGVETTLSNKQLPIRIKSEINTLNSITIDGVVVSGFSKDTTSYELEVDATKSEVNLAAQLTNAKSTLIGDTGTKQLSGGKNTFTFKVTSETGSEKTYVLTLKKPEIRKLKTLKINNELIELEDYVYEYTLKVNYDIESAVIESELNDPVNAKYVENFGDRTLDELEVGNNEILIKVNDLNDNTLTYKIIINRFNENGEDVTIQNPDTSGRIVYIVFIIFIFIGLLLYLAIRKYSKFPKKA